MKIVVKKPNTGDFLFMTALFLYTAEGLLSASALSLIVPHLIFNGLSLLALLLIIIKWFVTEKFNSTKFMVWIILFGVALIIVTKSSYTNLIILLSLLLSSQDVEFDTIIRNLFKWVFFWTAFIMILYFVGFLPDFTYSHFVDGQAKIVHSYGFKYYGGVAFSSMSLSIMYLYMRKNTKLWENIIFLLINYWLYTLHTVRLVWISIVVFTILNYLCEKTRFLDLNKRIYKFIATILPFAMFAFTLEMVKLYSEGKLTLGGSLETIETRLRYSVQAFEIYGVNMFGTYVKQYGGYAKYYLNSKTGFFVDSGYIYILIAYGIIFAIMLMTIYTLLYRYIYETKNKKLYIWLGMVLVISVINNFLLSVYYCPIIFYIPKMIRDVRGKRLKEQEQLSD